MAVSKTRAYLRALALYQARTGVAPLDTTRNIIQDIVQAILEEIIDNSSIATNETLKFKLPTGYTISVNTGSSTNITLNEITATLTQELTVVQK